MFKLINDEVRCNIVDLNMWLKEWQIITIQRMSNVIMKSEEKGVPELWVQLTEVALLSNQTFSLKCLLEVRWPCYTADYRDHAADFYLKLQLSPKRV